MIGDHLISNIASCIQKHFRDDDIVGRFGGDEFAVLMKNTADLTVVAQKCEQLNADVSYIHREGGRECPVTLSIGAAMSPIHGHSYEELTKSADAALYLAKKRGRNTFVLFESNATLIQ